MSHPIKFRVWDKSLKIFLPIEYKYSSDYSTLPAAPLIDIHGRLWDWASQHWGINNELCENQDNYIIQQFTGLLDKNGKEIYEGDIVQWNLEIGAVEYSMEDFAYIVKYVDTFIYLNDFELEVIGNIFENPSLLN